MNIENEKKYLIKGLNENKLAGVTRKSIIQYYLDIEDEEIKHLVKNLFHIKDVSNLSEVRIRVINKTNFILTAKSNTLNAREEYETPIIFKDCAINLINTKSIGHVAKVRYEYKGVEIDFFKNRDLCLAEMEYEDMTEQQVDEHVKAVIDELATFKVKEKEVIRLIDSLVMKNGYVQFDIPQQSVESSKIKIVDVTMDSRCKNKNLMTPCTRQLKIG